MKTWRGSLRQRLLIGTLAWIVASVGLAGWGLSALFADHVARQFDGELRMHLNQLAANLAFDNAGRPVLEAALSDPRLSRPYAGLYWQVDPLPGKDGIATPGLLRSRSLWDFVLRVPGDRLADGEIHQHRLPGPDGQALRMIEQVLRLDDQPEQAVRLIVAADETLLHEPVTRFTRLLLLALAVLGGGLGVAAIVQVRVGLRPLIGLREELGELREGRQSTIDGDFPSEVQPLVDELNGVLARNQAFVERARSQAGNLAHAIKTPLSILANAAAAEPGPLADVVATQVGLARQQVDHHLARARAAAAAQLPGQSCRLRPAIEGLLRVMNHLHVDRELHIELRECPDHLAFRGEGQDLQEMLGNLLDNACKWAGTRVSIQAGLEDNALRIEIDDDGPGIAADQQQHVLQRGVRGDERVPGSGLGLAIVDDLARLYGGRLELLNSPLGGLRVDLWLPAGVGP
ncbi:MAG: HAMP domain-containing histidine kinase [Dechloromonas sp.]|nr:HAMP domain-containing histidine kinase [Dechloromonas sp.]